MTNTVMGEEPFGVPITDGIDIRQLIRNPEIEGVPTVLQQFEISLKELLISTIDNNTDHVVGYYGIEDGNILCTVSGGSYGRLLRIKVNTEGKIIEILSDDTHLLYDAERNIYHLKDGSSVYPFGLGSKMSAIVSEDDIVLFETPTRESGVGSSLGISVQYLYDPTTQTFISDNIYDIDDKYNILYPKHQTIERTSTPLSAEEHSLIIKQPIHRTLRQFVFGILDSHKYYYTSDLSTPDTDMWIPMGVFPQYVQLNYSQGETNITKSEILESLGIFSNFFWYSFPYNDGSGKYLIVLDKVTYLSRQRIFELEMIRDTETGSVKATIDGKVYDVGCSDDFDPKERLSYDYNILMRLSQIMLAIFEEKTLAS